MCQSIYDPHVDKEVRITFSIHERLRALPEQANDKAFRAEIDERLGAVSGLSMLTLSDFQRLFPQQRLPPDESLDITRIALVFTDLAGSTALYARRGDPRAYHLVHLHFRELFRVADMCHGMVVKTIGDAILAAFQTPHEALYAAMSMQNAIAGLNQQRQLDGEERLILKVGVHAGPCISVTLNDRPDYFGTTVNTAARVQGLSKGNDIVFTDAISTDRDAANLLEGRKLESSEVTLKGIENRTRVHYLPQQEVPGERLAV
jgi:class 3 adenylate cyclase